MRSRDHKTLQAMGIVALLLLLAVSAHAESWAPVYDDEEGFLAVDLDSIRQEADGLVYYRTDTDIGVVPVAVDCQNHIYYVVGSNIPDWRSRGSSYVPGSDTAEDADIVCARI